MQISFDINRKLANIIIRQNFSVQSDYRFADPKVRNIRYHLGYHNDEYAAGKE
jgi:hypothetical protein